MKPHRVGSAMRTRDGFPGEIAGASLKPLPDRREIGIELRFPGEIAGASLKPRGRPRYWEEAPAGLACPRGDLGQPDHRLDRLDLAEEGPDAGESVIPPVPEQACGLRGHPPLVRGR